MRDLVEVVDAGKQLFDAVMHVDREKAGVAKPGLEMRLDALFMQFCRRSDIEIDVQIKFGDVHALMNKQWHTQLAFVEFDGRRFTLNFHDRIVETTDPFAGFVFVAKSWVLLIIVAQILAGEPHRRGRFVFEIGDCGGLDSVSFCSNHPDACLIPDYEFITKLGYAAFRRVCAASSRPWEHRLDRVFWRGSSTGQRLKAPPAEGQSDDLRWLQRLQLCVAAQDPAVAARCDIGIAHIVQVPEAYLAQRIIDAGLMRPPVPREDFLKFKYVIDIDGNSNAWSSLFCSLLGGSCVLKVTSLLGYRQWYYEKLIPGHTIISVASNLSDFAYWISWTSAHSAEAAKIAAMGQRLAESITLERELATASVRLASWLAHRA